MSDQGTWVNWEGKEVPCHQINWREEIFKAQADEGRLLDDTEVINGRFGGNLAPCKAGGGVRLRAEDPVPIA